MFFKIIMVWLLLTSSKLLRLLAKLKNIFLNILPFSPWVMLMCVPKL